MGKSCPPTFKSLPQLLTKFVNPKEIEKIEKKKQKQKTNAVTKFKVLIVIINEKKIK